MNHSITPPDIANDEQPCPICYEELVSCKKCEQCKAKICLLCFVQMTKLDCPLCRKKYELTLAEEYVMNNFSMVLASDEELANYFYHFGLLVVVSHLRKQGLL